MIPGTLYWTRPPPGAPTYFFRRSRRVLCADLTVLFQLQVRTLTSALDSVRTACNRFSVELGLASLELGAWHQNYYVTRSITETLRVRNEHGSSCTLGGRNAWLISS